MSWLERELRCPVLNAFNKRDGHVDQEASASCSGTRHAIHHHVSFDAAVNYLSRADSSPSLHTEYVHTAMSDQCNVNEDPAVIPVIFNKQICVPESSLDYFSRVV
jgi:hypothetical protein